MSLAGPHAALPLDGFFAVNPAMPVFARLFKDKQAAVVHAAATGYRERSHFDGQDVLESGFAGPGHVATGWLNRALESLPAGDRVATLGGLAVGPSTPLVIRGAAPVLGWATHANEGGATGRLATLLGGLDGAFEEFEKGLGERWKDTAIVAITEFGRTAQINGSVGTDHGTGTVVLLAGGAIKGGRIIADWPGLKPAQLYEQRDLAPTSDVRAVLKGLLADQFGLSAAVLADKVFPESAAAKPMRDLIA
ncbi:hypothetical protein MesoLj131b_01300 [Mesorhizobium sp. 131-2-5]|nr:hypothetical protein MesoLj131b_01300 [Mesorhizobium sp. 131-2-5]